ncbi:GNAT family N-acetyltransferase [Actinacidiphila glaucinigra]|uniref:GNAT family N-acetyltransferase n=1 Tax=Actinacidiphila glaucinigra TaxID=235986 RepID=UPI003D93215F
MELLRSDDAGGPHGGDTTYAGAVAGWPVTAREVALWCGRHEHPLAGAVVAGWRDAEDVEAYLLYDGPELVGYGELWLDAEEDEVELARVIVAPSARGRGLGRRLIAGLTARARLTGLAEVFLRVHPDNDAALRCYLGAGFAPVPAEQAAEWNVPQPVAYIWLRHAN